MMDARRGDAQCPDIGRVCVTSGVAWVPHPQEKRQPVHWRSVSADDWSVAAAAVREPRAILTSAFSEENGNSSSCGCASFTAQHCRPHCTPAGRFSGCLSHLHEKNYSPVAYATIPSGTKPAQTCTAAPPPGLHNPVPRAPPHFCRRLLRSLRALGRPRGPGHLHWRPWRRGHLAIKACRAVPVLDYDLINSPDGRGRTGSQPQ